MSLLITAEALERRRRDVRGSLAPLLASLRAELEPVLRSTPDLPEAKALLSREGGRCARDGATLDFDPFSPHAHRCLSCGATYTGERHHRWWVLFGQLWLAERAVHGALLYALTDDADCRRLAEHVLGRAADRYLAYPNRDNVLGPTRPFFSTYLESIWLLQLCIALDLLEMRDAAGTLSQRVRECVLVPSSELIASYDEGASNRQVWNNAALLASSVLLGTEPATISSVVGPSGLVQHLEGALLPDGTWYEGENYHLFAHRGLWYGVVMAERAGFQLPPDLVARFEEGFATPLLTALPDFTFPSRRDSQYKVSLRQWRFADSCELGLARGDDRRLVGALWELYESAAGHGAQHGEGLARRTGRWRSAAEVERNDAASTLARADAGWRSLLVARAELPSLEPVRARSALLEGQGIVVFRRNEGRVYAALDYGHSGGGHGHPDRLNILLAEGEQRLLDDVGTGSYVDRSLHWYRSTLAHNAPLIDGRSQLRADGVLTAFEERGGAGWASAEVPPAGIAPNVTVARTIIAMPDYIVDQVTWRAPREVMFDLPFHVAAEPRGVGGWRSATPEGGDGVEDGFSWLRETAVAPASADAVVTLALREAAGAGCWVLASGPAEWWRGMAPGPPGSPERRFHFARLRGRAGSVTSVWCWSASVRAVSSRDGALVVSLADGAMHTHARRENEWRVELSAAGARSSIDLGGERTPRRRETPPPAMRALVPAVVPLMRNGGAGFAQ
ncbi:MAG: heparinase II/III family protein, partial [Gemmatimonadaceae bacterium]